MSQRVLPTVQALSEAATTRVERGDELTVRPLEARTPKPKMMIMETGEGGAAHWEYGDSRW